MSIDQIAKEACKVGNGKPLISLSCITCIFSTYSNPPPLPVFSQSIKLLDAFFVERHAKTPRAPCLPRAVNHGDWHRIRVAAAAAEVRLTPSLLYAK